MGPAELGGEPVTIEDELFVAHGGALDEARLRHPFAPEPWIDLSTGVNPFPYPLPPIPPEAWARLPFAREDFELRQAAAVRYGAGGAENIAAAPGTQALIQIIPRLISPTRVAVLSSDLCGARRRLEARRSYCSRGWDPPGGYRQGECDHCRQSQ